MWMSLERERVISVFKIIATPQWQGGIRKSTSRDGRQTNLKAICLKARVLPIQYVI